MFLREIDFEAVPHVEDLVHFAPGRLRFLLDEREKRRGGEEIVFDDAQAGSEFHHFGLAAAGAMDHAVEVWPQLREELFYHRQIGAGRGEEQLAYVDAGHGRGFAEAATAAIDKLLVGAGVVAFGVAGGVVVAEHVVAGRGEAVAAHAAVVAVFVGSLPKGGEGHEHIAGAECIFDDVLSAHARKSRVTHIYGAYYIAHVGSFAAG